MRRVEVGEQVKSYFRGRCAELRALAQLATCEHPGLIGGHRETIQRTFFEHVLPRRFSVGRGMVYGTHHRSREADVVIWDSQNYPSLPLSDHNFFFAESVRAVLECKSSFSAEEFLNVRVKSKAARDIVPRRDPGLAQAVEMLQLKVHAMQTGRSFGGMMIDTPHIGTGAIFILGGGKQDWKFMAEQTGSDVDDSWPDICLLLEPGVILLKEYEIADGWMGGRGYLSQYSLGEGALLVFVHLLYRLLFDRSTALETPLNLLHYAPDTFSVDPEWTLQFPLTRVVPQNFPFMRDSVEER